MPFDLIQINWAEYDLRFQNAARLASTLLPKSRQKWPTNPAITILCAAIDRSLAGPNDPQITLAAVAFNTLCGLVPKYERGGTSHVSYMGTSSTRG